MYILSKSLIWSCYEHCYINFNLKVETVVDISSSAILNLVTSVRVHLILWNKNRCIDNTHRLLCSITGTLWARKKFWSKEKEPKNSRWIMLESLSTGTFLHHGILISLSGLDRERCFWREFLTYARAYCNDVSTQGKKARKLTLKSPVVLKQTLNCKITYTFGARTYSKSHWNWTTAIIRRLSPEIEGDASLCSMCCYQVLETWSNKLSHHREWPFIGSYDLSWTSILILVGVAMK